MLIYLMDSNYLFKILLIGDSGVGKTSLIMRFTKNIFNEDFLNSIGVDFKSKDLNVEGKKIKLQIWDTAGQERFRTITSSYYRTAHAIAIVFDITRRQSYEHVKRWVEDINKYAKENTIKFLIGNKTDLANEKQVSYEEARALASQMNMTYFHLSAKRNENINEFFEAAARIFLIKYNLYEEENYQNVRLNSQQVRYRNNNRRGKKKNENC